MFSTVKIVKHSRKAGAGIRLCFQKNSLPSLHELTLGETFLGIRAAGDFQSKLPNLCLDGEIPSRTPRFIGLGAVHAPTRLHLDDASRAGRYPVGDRTGRFGA
jgi:hypothetical protein